jgi:predicted amidohydrolase YtcJ
MNSADRATRLGRDLCVSVGPLLFLLLLLAPSFVSRTAWAQPAEPPADTIVINARIYTVNSRQPWAEGLAIKNGKLVAVGDKKHINSHRGPSTKTIDANGHLVLPGFTDCHIHFMSGSLSLLGVNLDDAKTVAAIQKKVKEFADAHPNNTWIVGRGWSYPVFGAAALPDKKYLDQVVVDRPVYLEGFDGHTYWANSKALEKAGITKDTPDPPNGKIVRDPTTGEATGALKEAAFDLVNRVVPKPTREERLQALRQGLREANKAGLVRVHSAGQDFEYLDLYDELRKQGQLTVRFYIAYFLDPPELTPAILDQIEQARRTYHDDWISGGAVKTMLDGVVESHTAAMLEPYSDDPSQTGKLFWDPAKYKQTVAELDRRGFQVFTHAIGDRAVRLALDAYEEAHNANGTKDSRDRIEHIETITTADILRFGKLGVIASMQPLHSYPDEDTLSIWARNAGPERATRAFAWNSIAASGGRLAFGSDWPVVTLSPWAGVQNALTRQTTEGMPPGGFLPKERVSLAQTIEAYTLGAAYAGKREKTEGSLEPGKLADLIVLSQNLFNAPPNKARQTEVLVTMVGGKVVWESPEWTAKSAAAGAK